MGKERVGSWEHTNCLAFIAAAPDDDGALLPICVVFPKFLVAMISPAATLALDSLPTHRSSKVRMSAVCSRTGGMWRAAL